MVLVRHLVAMEKEKESTYDPKIGHELPWLPLYQARQVMTRAEFIQQYDHMNIFTIDSKCHVRADSVPMQIAFREVATEEGFDEYLDDTLQRISDIESLGRTREITIKDLWDGGKYNMVVKNKMGRVEKIIAFDVEKGKKEKEGKHADWSVLWRWVPSFRKYIYGTPGPVVDPGEREMVLDTDKTGPVFVIDRKVEKEEK